MNETISAALLLIAAASSAPAAAQSSDPLQDLAKQMVRSIDFDLCLPIDSIEYEALGKHAVIKLVTSTAIASELPLRSVYVDIRGVNVPLRRIWRSEVSRNGDRFEQTSFYAVPIQFTKKSGRLLADFTGERRGFGIYSFGPTIYDDDAPAFVRLDAYDSPGEPDDDALRKLLIREYPDYFSS
ncbi:hypothetical protein OVY29_03845 [Sphingopyxis sp. SE2]|uniref:hypothetical protein n=1 Tax=Sphingopyxis sp. SE2 TaxID=1586240 RepID=UPI0028C2FD9F|nr:hypothetical protein [Sphingopyxis sp. SE2]MDT7527795.1 hypothetical protein [Sphingopyxis sp. SE2]